MQNEVLEFNPLKYICNCAPISSEIIMQYLLLFIYFYLWTKMMYIPKRQPTSATTKLTVLFVSPVTAQVVVVQSVVKGSGCSSGERCLIVESHSQFFKY